jgi:N-acetylmuramoyl-L-alanine amidase CwlA
LAWKGIVGKAVSPEEFRQHVDGLSWGAWRPAFITLHNTAIPSLAQRPHGFTEQHIRNLEGFYRGKGWSAGPHLFIDDKQIWLFTPLTTPGVHSPSWNRTAIGIEMLGDYAKESFSAGRGLLVRRNTVAAMAALSKKLGFKPDGWKFHVQDTASDHDCPGKLARDCRADLVKEIAAAMSKL